MDARKDTKLYLQVSYVYVLLFTGGAAGPILFSFTNTDFAVSTFSKSQQMFEMQKGIESNSHLQLSFLPSSSGVVVPHNVALHSAWVPSSVFERNLGKNSIYVDFTKLQKYQSERPPFNYQLQTTCKAAMPTGHRCSFFFFGFIS